MKRQQPTLADAIAGPRTAHARAAAAPSTTRPLGVALAVALLGGCAVGPDYARPELPASQGYSAAPLPLATASSAAPGGTEQRLMTGRDIQADWWTVFESPQLNALIARAFAANPTLEAAHASLRVAQENVYAQRGFFFPTLSAGYSPARTKLAGNLGGNSPGIQGNGTIISTSQGTPVAEGGIAPFSGPVIYNFHTAQLTVGFVPDVFGGNRRQVEALAAQARLQKLQLEAAYITLASNVVAAAIQEALVRQQIATTGSIIAANIQSVELLQRQLKAGYVSKLDLTLQESALSQARQQLPPLQKQLEQTRNLLRALAGTPQDRELPETFELAALRLPAELPLTVPSQLVEQRPDVRAAEEQLHSASAQVGVAIADRLPKFSIDAAIGGAASRFSQMFWSSGRFFNLTGNLLQPLFDGGTLLHRQRAAQEQLRQAAAQYQSTVITSFQNVADTLQAIHADAQALDAAVTTESKTRTTLELIRRQQTRGYVDRLALLGAEQTHHQAVLALDQAYAARLGDTAALFQALGGGWWHRTPDAEMPRQAVKSAP